MDDRVGQDERGTVGLVDLDLDACWDFLARHHIGRVAVVEHGLPVLYPVNYALDGHSVVFRTGSGSKLKAASAGVEVAFEVDEADPVLESGTSVIVHGRFREISDPDRELGTEALALRPWAPGPRDHFVRIVAEQVTGRRIRAPIRDDGVAADGG